MLIVDGSKISTNPAAEIIRIQQFLSLDIEIDEKNFVYNNERGFYCFKEAKQSSCLGSGKGRSHGLNFEPVLNKRLHDFFQIFDQHFANMVSLRFKWDFK